MTRTTRALLLAAASILLLAACGAKKDATTSAERAPGDAKGGGAKASGGPLRPRTAEKGRYQLPTASATTGITATTYVVVGRDSLTVGRMDDAAGFPGRRVELAELEPVIGMLARGLDPWDPTVTDDARPTQVIAKPPEEPAEEEQLEEEDPGTGEKQALEEGKMGRKDPTRPGGQYAMKKRQDDPPSVPGGKRSLHHVHVPGEMQGGFGTGNRDGERPRPGDPDPAPGVDEMGQFHAALVPEDTLVLADAGASAARLAAVLQRLRGAQLAVATTGANEAAALALAWSQGDITNASPPRQPPPQQQLQLILEVTADALRLASSDGQELARLPRHGAHDLPGLANAYRTAHASAAWRDRTDITVEIVGDAATVQDLVGVLETLRAEKAAIGLARPPAP